MIENATELFGTGILDMLEQQQQQKQVHCASLHTGSLDEPTRHRPLSATESTASSSRASSSTSGVHSESPVFSSEPDSASGRLHHHHIHHHHQAGSLSNSSISPSSGSSPSPMGDSGPTSPVQDGDSSSAPDETDCCTTLVIGKTSVKPTLQTAFCTRTSDSSLAASHQAACLGRESSSLDLDSIYSNRQMMDRYGTYMSFLNRAPKIPVQFTTSNYGGEAVIYNPRPVRRQTKEEEEGSSNINSSGDCIGGNNNSPDKSRESNNNNSIYSPIVCVDQKSLDAPAGPLNSNSTISVKPLTSTPSKTTSTNMNGLAAHQARVSQMFNGNNNNNSGLSAGQQQQLHLNHHQQQQQHQQHQHHQHLSSHQSPSHSRHSAILKRQNGFSGPEGFMSPAHSSGLFANQPQAGDDRQQQQQQQHNQQRMFYSAKSMSSLHQEQQPAGLSLQDIRYLLCNRSLLEQRNSHVISLRNHYLALQQNQQIRQQQLNSYRDKLNYQSGASPIWTRKEPTPAACVPQYIWGPF